MFSIHLALDNHFDIFWPEFSQKPTLTKYHIRAHCTRERETRVIAWFSSFIISCEICCASLASYFLKVIIFIRPTQKKPVSWPNLMVFLALCTRLLNALCVVLCHCCYCFSLVLHIFVWNLFSLIVPLILWFGLSVRNLLFRMQQT